MPRLLWFYLRARHSRDGHSYCSVKGCERVKVMATTSSKQICNCSAKAYPKYSKTPSAVVPMPAVTTKPCNSCGAKQVCVAASKSTYSQMHEIHTATADSLFPPQLVFSSEPWTSYLQTQVKSLCSKEQLRGDNISFITVSMAGQF